MSERRARLAWLALGLLLRQPVVHADGDAAVPVQPRRADAGVTQAAPGQARSPAAAGRYRGQVQVTVRGFRNGRGQALLALFRSATGFPTTTSATVATQVVPIVDGVASARFVNVAPGPFAVTVLHDEDGDGKLGQGFFGIPNEGLGFSRNPTLRFGPPAFDDCMVVLGRGKRETLSIALHYY